MATQEEMSRYFWSASTNCPPVLFIYIKFYIYEQCFSLSACGARQITEECGELNINWHLEAFGAFYTPFWAAYGLPNCPRHRQIIDLLATDKS
jgi:hypothetical protein